MKDECICNMTKFIRHKGSASTMPVANKLNHVDENNYTEAYMKMLYIQEDIETD